MIKVNDVIKFLVEEDKSKIMEYSKFLLNCNEKRKKISSDFN